MLIDRGAPLIDSPRLEYKRGNSDVRLPSRRPGSAKKNGEAVRWLQARRALDETAGLLEFRYRRSAKWLRKQTAPTAGIMPTSVTSGHHGPIGIFC